MNIVLLMFLLFEFVRRLNVIVTVYAVVYLYFRLFQFVHRSGESTTASPSSGDGGTVAPSPQPSVVSDVGVYQCVLSNDVGTLLSRTSKVNMAGEYHIVLQGSGQA
jgi:hypothetical protein